MMHRLKMLSKSPGYDILSGAFDVAGKSVVLTHRLGTATVPLHVQAGAGRGCFGILAYTNRQ